MQFHTYPNHHANACAKFEQVLHKTLQVGKEVAIFECPEGENAGWYAVPMESIEFYKSIGWKQRVNVLLTCQFIQP